MQKGIYPHEFMDGWEKISETSLREKEDFYSHLNVEDITDEDYGHGKKRFWNKKKLGEYHDEECHSIYWYAVTNTLKIMIKLKNGRIFNIEI